MCINSCKKWAPPPPPAPECQFLDPPLATWSALDFESQLGQQPSEHAQNFPLQKRTKYHTVIIADIPDFSVM